MSAVYRGEWKKHRITGFQELMDHIFGKFDPGEEFYKAKMLALDYFRKNKHPPRKYKDDDFRYIMLLIKRGMLKSIGIDNWSDFLEKSLNINLKVYKKEIFLKNIKQRREHKEWKPHGYYKGEKGFKNAINEVMKYLKENGKMPYSSSRGMSGLYNAIRKGKFIVYGINS